MSGKRSHGVLVKSDGEQRLLGVKRATRLRSCHSQNGETQTQR